MKIVSQFHLFQSTNYVIVLQWSHFRVKSNNGTLNGLYDSKSSCHSFSVVNKLVKLSLVYSYATNSAPVAGNVLSSVGPNPLYKAATPSVQKQSLVQFF